MNVKIQVKNITPLCQIEGNRKERFELLSNEKSRNPEIDVTTVKTITILYEGIPVEIPIYTANGFRGLLRRVIGAEIIAKSLEKGINVSPSNFHLMMAGGGNNYQTQPFEVEEQIRELNPLISVFGTSLAIEGKLMVTHLTPEDPLIKIKETDDGTLRGYSQLLKRYVFIKKDDLLQKTKYGRLLSKEDIINWEKEVKESQKQRKEEREIGEKATKKKAIQSILAKYYVIPNTKFIGFLGNKYPLTEIEEGMLISGLRKIVTENLGSTLNLGFGICDWEIDIGESGSKIIAKSKQENIFDKEISLVLSDEDEEKLKRYNDWLENLEPKNIQIDKILKK